MTTVQIKVSRKESPEIIFPSGNFAFLQHDDLADDWKGQRIRAPEVWPFYWVEYTELTEEWQWYWFRVGLVHPYTGYRHWNEKLLADWEFKLLQSEWSSLTHGAKAFTNNFGTEKYRDYINDENQGMDNPMQGAITCCGNLFRVIGDRIARGTPIETLDGRYPPPPIEKVNRLTRPDLIFCAVNIPGKKVAGVEVPLIVESGPNKGRIKADPFPNLWDHPSSKSKDTLVPLRTNGAKSDYTYERDGVHYARNYISRASIKRLFPWNLRIVPDPYVQ